MAERSRPRLFAFPREIELAWVADAGLDDDARATLESMADAFGEVARTRRLQAVQLHHVARAAAHADPTVRVMGMTRLTVLAHYFPDGAACLLALLDHASVDVRVTVAASLPNAAPPDAVQGLARALDDADWRVRKAAAQAATAAPLPGLLDALVAHRADADARVRVWIEQAVAHQQRCAEVRR